MLTWIGPRGPRTALLLVLTLLLTTLTAGLVVPREASATGGAPALPVPIPVPATPIVPATSAGYLPDSSTVTPDGAFTDSIPLDVPAGRAGMQPSLSLGYSSAGGNGLVGMGWSVGGATSEITRCARTLATEGTVSGIRYDKSDRFCLDGQKLVAVGAVGYGGGGYGEIDTQYRTENDSFAQIISVGADPTIASGPDAFVVNTKDGQVLRYEPFNGLLATSGIGFFPQPGDWTDSTAWRRVRWLLTKQSDRSGNEIRWTYTGDAASGDYRPDKITYTYNTGVLAGSRYVQFTYEDRPDVVVGYQAGVKHTMSKRVKSIEMYAPNPAATSLVWRYNLSYTTSPATKRSLLTSVTKCSPTGGCLKAKQFGWNSPAALPSFQATAISQSVYPVAGIRPPALQVMDLDGDGTDDIIYAMGGSSDADDPVYARLGYRHTDGTVAALADLYPLASSLPANTEVARSRPLDLDGDGKVEYDAKGQFGSDTVLRWSSGAKKFEPTGVSFPGGASTDFGDMNGDGRADALATDKMTFGTGTGFGADHTMPKVCRRQVTDLDGDGRAELVGTPIVQNNWCTGHPIALRADDTGKVTSSSLIFQVLGQTLYRALPTVLGSYATRQGDFNGDGLTDSILIPNDTAQPATVVWNTGAGVKLDTHTVAIPRDQYNDVRVSDANGDGRDDLVAFGAKSVLLVSMGDGTFVSGEIAPDSGTVVAGLGRTTTQLGDFNGDGRVDIVRVVNDKLNLLTQTSIVGIDRIKSVRDEGVTLPRENVTYGLSWTDHSEKIPQVSCAYPLICQRHGMVVVRQVDSQAHNVDVPAASATARTLMYSYEDPVADVRGRGFLGFGVFRVWDPQRPAETITRFDHRTPVDGNHYPGAGHPASVTTVVPILTLALVAAKPAKATARVSEVKYVTEPRWLNGGASFAVMPVSSTTKVWEQMVTLQWGQLGGPGGSPAEVHVGNVQTAFNPLVVVYKGLTLDDFGNVTHQERKTTGGVISMTDTTYDNRLDDWLIGLPSSTATTSKEPDNVPMAKSRHLDNTFDALGRLETQTVEKGNPDSTLTSTTSYAYNALGVVQAATVSAAGQPDRVTHMEYEPFFAGQPDEEIYVSQMWSEHSIAAYRPSLWTAVHPGYGVVIASEDVNGVLSTATYDNLGRRVSATATGQAPTGYSYGMRVDKAGGTNGTVITASSNGRVGATSTDRLGRPIVETSTGFNGQITSVTTSYDLLGRLASRSRPFTGGQPNSVTSHGYDSLDREVVTTQPGGAQLKAAYSLFTTKAIDANGHETDTTVDVDGRIVKRIAHNVTPGAGVTPITTKYEYGPFGQVDKVIDDKGNTTSYTYDVLGRRTVLDEPDRGVTETTHYPTGEIHTQTRLGTGDTTTYSYDELGRISSTVSNDGTTSFSWDTSANGIGRLAAAVSTDNIRTNFRYDSTGRTDGIDYIDESDNYATYTVNRSYDGNGRLADVSFPDASGNVRFALDYTYNNHGFLSVIAGTDAGGVNAPIWSVTDRHPDLSLHTGALGANGQIAVDHTNDPITGRLTDITATAGATKMLGLSYGFDANGVVTSRTQADVTGTRAESYDYDSIGRLVDWKLTNGNAPTVDTGYAYDTIGNLLTITSSGPAALDERSFGNPQPHQLTVRDATLAGGELNSYEYDGQGRLVRTKAEDDSVKREISYTAADLPRKVTVGGQVWDFAYDAFGQRVKQTGPDGTTFTVPGAYERRNLNGQVSYAYRVQGSDGPVAQVTVDGAGTHTDYLLTDSLGSVSAVVDEGGGATFEPLWYDPFGARVNADGSALTGGTGDVRAGYTGHQHDDDLGLINMVGRMYDPALQRFTSADPYVTEPLSGQSWNPYSYVRNSPTNLVDPTGFQYNTCAAAPYMPECSGMAGGLGSWGAVGSGGGWGGGGSGGYDQSKTFNPSFYGPDGKLQADGGYHDRLFQHDMAEFFGAAEAYGDGGVAGLSGWGKGALGREIGWLEAEQGFQKQAAKLSAAAKLAASAKSDSAGYRAPKITIGSIETSSSAEQPEQQAGSATGATIQCSDPMTATGTPIALSICTSSVPGSDAEGSSAAWIYAYNLGGFEWSIDSITIYKNGEAMSLGCAPGAIAPGASSVCGWDTTGDGYTSIYSAEAHYRSALDDDYTMPRSFWFDGWLDRPGLPKRPVSSW